MNQETNDQERCNLLSLRNDLEKAILASAGLSGSGDPDARALLRLIDATSEAQDICGKLQRTAVHQARRADIPWSAIGDLLGMSRQAAQQRFAPEEAVPPASGTFRHIHGANAFNEMGILEAEGRAGYHLVGFGPLYLTVLASDQVWEHLRVVSLSILNKRLRLEAAGWTYVGSWFPFHYFKRAVG